MKLNQLIAQALNKPVEALTIEDVIKALNTEVATYDCGPILIEINSAKVKADRLVLAIEI